MSTYRERLSAIEELKALRARQRRAHLRRQQALLVPVFSGFAVVILWSLQHHYWWIIAVALAVLNVPWVILTRRPYAAASEALHQRASELNYELSGAGPLDQMFAEPIGPLTADGKPIDTALATAVGRHCRSCCSLMLHEDPRTVCRQCAGIFHTACMGADGLCRYCARGEPVPAPIEQHCRAADRRIARRYLLAWAGSLPERESAPLDDPSPYDELEEDAHRNDVLSDDEQEVHGWPVSAKSRRESGCCLVYYLWMPAALCFLLRWHQLGGAIVILALSYLAYLLLGLAADWIRGRMWPLQAPSPAKRRLIMVRTWCFSIAGILYLLTVLSLAFDNEPGPLAGEITLFNAVLCGVVLLIALLLGLVSLALR